jgi:hypothetical protein
VLDNVDLMDLMLKPAHDELQQAMARPAADREEPRKPEWAAKAAESEACTACHRAFAREAPTIKR